MKREIEYSHSTDEKHLKKYGQYFTPPAVAAFMCDWTCRNAGSVLDPAVGNSIFLLHAGKCNPLCTLTGYEIDPGILDFFGNPANAQIHLKDYLLSDWESRYDAIVCNPPYNRFQAVENREEILDTIFRYTGRRYSKTTNLYSLFLLKSIYQMSETGRLAYIIPSEFLNSRYGTPIKEILLKEKLLRAIIHFQNDRELFFNATTTCCILLLDKEPKDRITFWRVSSPDELRDISGALCAIPGKTSGSLSFSLEYSSIRAQEKWLVYLNQEEHRHYSNLKEVSEFCRISRGIATGDNAFFCMSRSKAVSRHIPKEALTECICRSADVRTVIFRREDFDRLAARDCNVYLLDVKDTVPFTLMEYLRLGERNGVSQKYLPSHRTPWYSMEQKKAAPIWVSSACRSSIKFIRNLAGVRTLTTFHGIYVREGYEEYTDILFCYFLTPTAQSILRENRKMLGNGLEKFQPGDLCDAKMLDLSLLSGTDRERILAIYVEMQAKYQPSQVECLDQIFSSYLR